MIAVAAFVAGALVSAGLWAAMGEQWRESPVLRRTNYRGHELPVAAGVLIPLAVVLVAAAYRAWVSVGGTSAEELGRGATLVGGGGLGAGVLGFALIGLVDDLVGSTTTKGFAGHLGALRRGRITTGLVKLVWGALIGIAYGPTGGGLVDALRIGAVIALAANLANLFDRAPGRVVKVSLLGGVVVALAGAPGWWLTGPMLVLGAGAGLLVADLRERCMLGDTGANALGAAVGWGLVLSLGERGQWIAGAVLLALNLASERVSFSRVIDAVPPLRWLDRLGTLPERRAAGR